MPEKNKTYRIFISAAEPSADAHCAGLITALKKSSYSFEFIGVGGNNMASAGCELLENTAVKAAMTYKAFSQIGRYYKLIKHIKNYLKNNTVDIVIVCDSPAFNFHIAKAAKKADIKTIFYVAPQLWAWGGWRIGKLRKCCDKLCCILPFEENWFRQRGLDAVFVGNPLLDEIDCNLDDNIKKYTDFEPKNARIALMPGSRKAEIDSLWPSMQQIAMRIKHKYPNTIFTTVAASDEQKQILKSNQINNFECEYTVSSVNKTARKADFAIVASGSATLQVAAAGCPMAIIYQSSKILWHLLGKWLLKIKLLSLVNILADRELVPEFMPYFDSIDPIAESVEQLLGNSDKLANTSRELIDLIRPLSKNKTCNQMADITIKLL
ncbi:MAG: lipid-A-disaccharide synthase [Planctomycetes bacterium]|nr:lipid-A-disaccharide synthase [Planctomycetota bacterium]MCK5473177.1 lipid-A-disaccharide synthase [Planctomycetota bacterium]